MQNVPLHTKTILATTLYKDYVPLSYNTYVNHSKNILEAHDGEKEKESSIYIHNSDRIQLLLEIDGTEN